MSTEARSLLVARAVARLFDSLLVLGPAAIILGAIGEVTRGSVVLVLLVMYLYETIAVGRYGTTLAKARMNLQVVDADTGARPLLSKAGTRILSVLAIAGLIHLLVPVGPAVAVFLWGSAGAAVDGRGVPDKLANTRVVRRH